MNTARAIQTLWQHAASSMPDTALAHLAAGEDNANALRHLALLAETLACLIDSAKQDGTPSGDDGNSQRLPAALFGLSAAIATQAELVAVASDAAAILRLKGTPGAA